jgi:hypothetical protein
MQLEREARAFILRERGVHTSGRDMRWSHDEDGRVQASDVGRRLGSAPDVLKGDSPKPRLETNFLVSLTPSDGALGPTTPSIVNSGGGFDARLVGSSVPAPSRRITAFREGQWR